LTGHQHVKREQDDTADSCAPDHLGRMREL
jgi:hypothetical protein